ncbi:hypothetical protein, partial [Mesorhizobium sp. M1A.F.Ca.ET.072.01.1.1]|uniref:hypothetical protein n=1 Tax=Mesorhizobium sp. M1A.F.Ca.ET.072.01.1.1 TaxID=2496753 RepID=UPI001AECE4D6
HQCGARFGTAGMGSRIGEPAPMITISTSSLKTRHNKSLRHNLCLIVGKFPGIRQLQAPRSPRGR